MSKARIGIARTLFDAAIAERPAGLRVADKAAWTKIEGPGGQKVYVQTSDPVRQVDLSGFGRDHAGCVNSDGLNGRVQAHLDLTAESAVATFRTILAELAAFPPAEARPRRAAAAPVETPPPADPGRAARIAERQARRAALVAEEGLETQVAADDVTGAHHPFLHADDGDGPFDGDDEEDVVGTDDVEDNDEMDDDEMDDDLLG